MLEILFLIWFGGRLRTMLREKGRSGGWIVMGVGFWIGGEVTGLFVGGFLGLGLASYLLALGFAGLGAATAHLVVKGLGPLETARF